jgi:imidazolonepropionase-like amidohydrolase
MSLLYLDIHDSANPWEEPVAAVLDPADINNPADAETGRHTHDAENEEAYAALANKMLVIESAYYAHGARYMAGSGTDVWKTMPGISLHTELELPTRIGLTSRQAIAAATTNIVEAFGWNDTGMVEEGRIADLLVVAEDPLDDLENLKKIDCFIKGGVILDRDSLLR